MKIRVLRNIGFKTHRKLAEQCKSDGLKLSEGDIANVANELGDQLIAKGLAEATDKKTTVKAVATKPAIAGDSEQPNKQEN